MFKIRSEQIRPFEQDARDAFRDRVIAYVRENHRDEQVSFRGKQASVAELAEEDLRTMVENGLARARSYGLTWKSSLNSFVVLMFVAAPNFDRDTYVAAVMGDENIPANRRVEIITEQLTDEDWEKIIEGYDEKAWEIVVAPEAAAAAADSVAAPEAAAIVSGGESK